MTSFISRDAAGSIMVYPYLLLILIIPIVLFFIRTIYVLIQIRNCRQYHKAFLGSRSSSSNNNIRRPRRPVKTLVVLGSGGHTTEILALIKHVHPDDYSIVFCKADTDTTSIQRLNSMYPLPLKQEQPQQQQQQQQHREHVVYDIPRSREVGQSYVSSIGTTLRAQITALYLVYRINPQLVLCNGPGTCLPICISVLIWRVLGMMPDARVVFVESLCRVRTLSLTGKLLYPLADAFFVHWPELQSQYPSSQRVHTFVS